MLTACEQIKLMSIDYQVLRLDSQYITMVSRKIKAEEKSRTIIKRSV